MEYDTYLLSILIAGAVILGIVIVKLLTVLCDYLRRHGHILSEFNWGTDVISGSSDETHYRGEPFTQRSALSHYEETPQPIVEMISGSATPSLPPFMNPPPYHIVVRGSHEKPPSYDEVVSNNPSFPFNCSHA